MTTTSATQVLPPDLDATVWAQLEPLYQALLDRELKCENCLEQLVLDRSELDAAVREAGVRLFISMTCHTDDEGIKRAYLGFVENVEPHLKQKGFELDHKIVDCPHLERLDGRRYEVMIRDTRADVELFREENIPLQTQETKLAHQYSEVCGAMTVDFRGEERTMPQMAKYQEGTDRAVREEAWRLTWDRRHKDSEKLDALFGEMIVLRDQIARNAGCSDYREYMFKAKHRFDYSPADCASFHQAAEEVCVPLQRELNLQRTEALGASPLRPWDLAVDVKGRDPLRPFEQVDELVEKASRMFHRMNDELGRLFDSLRGGDARRGNHSLDLESRKGKAPGGYQETLDRQRRPFIFMNATGMQSDLETLVHEAGHAFHAILSSEDALLHYRHPPLEFAEVASMGMELMAYPYLDTFYENEADAARAVRTHLEDLTRLFPWVATIDAFQHWLYTNPKHTSAERTEHWRSLQDRFGADVSWDGLEHYRDMSWQRQLHLFEVPFYYIEYGIAQLGALQLWLASRRDRSKALESYKRALTLGGSRPLPELFEAAELKFDFGPDTMRRLMDEVREELAGLPA